MLGGRGLRRLAPHPRSEKTTHWTGIQHGIEKAGPGALQAAEHGIFHRVADVALLRHGIDEAERLGTARVDGLAGQHQRHRLHRIDELGETRGAAEARMQPQHHLGETKTRIRNRNAGLTGQRNLEAAAEAKTVDHGDGRKLDRLQPVNHRMRARNLRLDRGRIGRAAEFIDVCAGDETGRLGGANDKPGRPLAFERRQHRVELCQHVGRQRIGAGAFAIEQQPRNAVRVARQLEISIEPACNGLRPEFEHTIGEYVEDMAFHDVPLKPSRSTWRRRARHRCIRWRCRAWCRAASSR